MAMVKAKIVNSKQIYTKNKMLYPIVLNIETLRDIFIFCTFFNLLSLATAESAVAKFN